MNDKQLYRNLGRKVQELESDLANYLHGPEKRACELEATNLQLKAAASARNAQKSVTLTWIYIRTHRNSGVALRNLIA